MKSLFRIFFFIIFLLPGYNFAQSDGDVIGIGLYKIIHSDILNQDRIISVYLPKTYDDHKRSYPVVYHLYGDRIDQYFAEAASVVYNLSSETIPEVILIGIDERNLRYRDLLPQSTDGTDTGINEFTDYLSKELLPYIDSSYRTMDYKIMVGPQVGANFGIYTLFKNPDLFDAYIITNPFRWTGGRELLFTSINSYISENASLDKFLFITHTEDDALEIAGNSHIQRFNEIVNEAQLDNFDVVYNYLPDGYNRISPTGFRTGLQTLFQGYKVPDDVEIKSLKDFQNYYYIFSQKVGFEVEIPDVAMALKSDELIEKGEIDTAVELLKYAESKYPNGLNALWRLGNIYKDKGEKETAISYYKKVLLISPEMKPAQDLIDALSK
jgi:predicted alpha/beta superfamily hydrolase